MPDDPTGQAETIARLRWALRLTAELAGSETTTVGQVNRWADAMYEVLRGEGYVLVRLSDFESEMLEGRT
jgi:predicted deacylase